MIRRTLTSILSRRGFLGGVLTVLGAGRFRSPSPAAAAEAGSGPAAVPARADVQASRTPAGYDPWIEVDGERLAANADEVRRLAGGRRLWAVIKNNGYGHGVVEAGRALASSPAVAGLAVVKVEEALELRRAGVTAPVLHMGYAPGDAARVLVEEGVQLSAFQPDDPERLARLAAEVQRPVEAQIYLDTGMSRMGLPVERADGWLERLDRSRADGVAVCGTYTALAELEDLDAVQVRRLREFATRARGGGLDPGPLHAASSYPLFHDMPAAGLDAVRPGLAVYGAYPAAADRSAADLRPALRLRARVVRTERLEVGDGVSYGRNYVATRPIWVATLPVGHVDGYPRSAVEGCRIAIGDRTYPVIGAVSASHTIVEVGSEERVRVGDVATLLGPDRPEVHPNAVAEAAGASVYDVLMHLGADLPRHPG